MSPEKVALVTGATGTVGPSIVRALLRDGYGVRALVRSDGASDVLSADVARIKGDLADARALRRAVEGADVVFHLAAKLHVNEPGPELAEEYRRINVDGTERLVEATVAAGVARFVFASTINVYGAGQPGLIFTESSPVDPQSLYARTKLEAERIVLRGHGGSTVLRLAAVYGPRMRGNYPLLVRVLDKGWPVMVGDGRNRRTLVYVEDVARAALLVANSEKAAGQVYNVTDGEVHTFDAVVRAMQGALGKPERVVYLPANPIRASLRLAERAGRILGKELPVGSAAVDKLVEDMAVSGAKLMGELSFVPRYDLSAGWRQAIGAAERS